MTKYHRNALPVVHVADENGNSFNLLRILSSRVVQDEDTYSVWVWTKGNNGHRFRSGMSEADAHVLARSLVDRVV